MATADASIDARVLASAQKEFLEKGFQDASLRAICSHAGVTTGALYNRFSGKEALFSEVVRPVIEDIKALSTFTENYNYDYLSKNEMRKVWDMSEDIHKRWINFFYERFDGMKLLLCCAEGSEYADFVDRFVRENVAVSLTFAKEAYQRGVAKTVPDPDELHFLLTAYWNALFEPIVHDFPLEKSLKYCKTISNFFNWQSVFLF